MPLTASSLPLIPAPGIFTSNSLVKGPGSQPVASIVDLHGLEDGVSLTYVVQRLAAMYGMRQDMLEDVLILGVCDPLGVAAGTALLRAELPQLVAEAERSCRGRQARPKTDMQLTV
jgi:hypothetical protein